VSRHGGYFHALFMGCRIGTGRTYLQSAGNRRNPNAGCASAPQQPGTFRDRGTGSENVVHQEDIATSDLGSVGDGESSANVLAPLMTAQAGLRLSSSSALENCRSEGQIEARRFQLQCGLSNQLRLIETTFAKLAFMQGNGNQQGRLASKIRGQPNDHVRQHPPEDASGRTDTVIFEQMQQVAETTLVAAVSCCF